jgi:hypothetical protein
MTEKDKVERLEGKVRRFHLKQPLSEKRKGKQPQQKF